MRDSAKDLPCSMVCTVATCSGALAQQIGGLAHDLGAVIGRSVLPDLEAFLRGAERGVEIGDTGVRQLRQHLAGRRIDDVFALAAGAIEPLAVDVQFEIGIHSEPRWVTRDE